MARRKLSPETLKDLASEHVASEVRMLVGQAHALYEKYGESSPGSLEDPREDALLEAALVHPRLLDEFLRSDGDKRNVRANDWVPEFRPLGLARPGRAEAHSRPGRAPGASSGRVGGLEAASAYTCLLPTA